MADKEHANAGDTANAGGEAQYATLDQITDATSEMINKALTSRNKQVEAKVEKAISELQKSFEEKLNALLEANKKTSTSETATQNSGTEGAGKAPTKEATKEAPKVEENPVVKELQAKLATVQKQLEATEREKRAERDRARDRDLRQKLSDELVKSGIDPTRVRHAVGLLVDADKRVRYVGDTDEVTFVKDEDGDEVDLKAGVKAWLKTDDAKIYLPARGTTGSGDRSSSKQKTQNGANPLEDLNNALLDALNRGDI